MEYFKLPINLILGKLLSDPLTLTLTVFITLLSYSENGQVKTSYRKHAEITGGTIDKVRIRLKNLEDMGLIQKDLTGHSSVVRICNIEGYVVD